jgi:hypothetical protein
MAHRSPGLDGRNARSGARFFHRGRSRALTWKKRTFPTHLPQCPPFAGVNGDADGRPVERAEQEVAARRASPRRLRSLRVECALVVVRRQGRAV